MVTYKEINLIELVRLILDKKEKNIFVQATDGELFSFNNSSWDAEELRQNKFFVREEVNKND